MPFGIQPIHIVIIIVVAFLIFGTTKLPELGRYLGRTLNEVRKGTKEAAEGFKEEMTKPNRAPAAPPQTSFPEPAGPAEPVGNFCIQCGSSNLPEARFCANCGAKLPDKVA